MKQLKKVSVSTPYQIYSSIPTVQIIKKLSHSMEELSDLPHDVDSAQVIGKAQQSAMLLLSLEGKAQPFRIVEEARQFLEAELFPIARNSSIAENLIQWQNRTIEQMSRAIVDLGGKEQCLSEMFPGAELYYVVKHYQGSDYEEKNPYARVCAGYIGPYEQDAIGHDTYLRSVLQSNYPVYIKSPEHNEVPDIYAFDKNDAFWKNGAW